MPKEQELQGYKCNICKDEGVIIENIDGYEVGKKCKCKIKEEIKSRISNSGIENLLKTKTFKNYKVEQPFQETIKSKAIKYTKEFIKGNKMSFAILGQSGAGKTHIMTAVAGVLINKGINVKYYVADEIIQKLNACKYDEENYNKEFSKIANAEVLFIDDLFKTSIQSFYKVDSINREDLRVIFQIINYRYNKSKPILLNSEITDDKFTELDQALIGRINEMCEYEYLISISEDTNKNYRLKGM